MDDQNVVCLDSYRSKQASHTVYYFSDEGGLIETLRSFSFLRTVDLCGAEALTAALCTQKPDMILLESQLEWIDSITLIENLSYLHVPIVLICKAGTSKDFLKKAFAAGVSDNLLAPSDRSELAESLDVLLKYRRKASY